MNNFEKAGYEVRHYYNHISVVIDDKEYHICDKVFGTTNYDDKINNAWNDAKKKGLIPITKWAN
tara:strand:+ start:265 stop:456 length:192 start_codon:yes stop_codon:yes gene_type:complete